MILYVEEGKAQVLVWQHGRCAVQAPNGAPARAPAALGSPFTTPLGKFGAAAAAGACISPASCTPHFVSPVRPGV